MRGYISFRDIADHLEIQKGDVLLVSSDIQRLATAAARNAEKFSPESFIMSLQNKLGNEGTLLFPAFNWDFCKGIAFDRFKTRCMTGSLGTAALKMEGFERSRHPIYSFAAWGRDRDKIIEMGNVSSFGGDSPFAYLHKFGRNLVVDISLRHCFTFAHYVEEQVGVPYRYMKNFTAGYRGRDGREEIRTYSMYVRRLDINVESVIDPIGDDLLESGLSAMKIINGVPFTVLRFADFYEAAEKDILENKARKLCRYDGQE
jgi:aminoglycoside 3-N-acetyltransferase